MIKNSYQLSNYTPNLNSDDIDEWYKEEFKIIANSFCNGDLFAIRYNPDAQNAQNYLCEYERALHVLKHNGFSAFKSYSIHPIVAEDVKKMYQEQFPEIKLESELIAKKGERKQKYALAENWCKENVGKKVTIKSIMKISKWSYPTANNFVRSRPNVFEKIAKGVYIIRDVNSNATNRRAKNADKK